MNILVTGSNGFVGKNLVENLNNIKYGKNRNSGLVIDEIFCFDVDTEISLLDEYTQKADFVFNFAGVNRPKNNEEFKKGNSDFTETLLNSLRKNKNTCPVMLSSSVGASLTGRFADSEYGKSKLSAENILFKYSEETGAKVYIFRFPNVFGKWCKPNYNSAVATFCHNIANDLPVQITDRETELELLYIDDLVNEMLNILNGVEHRCDYNGMETKKKEDGKFCYVPVTYKVTLGEIVDFLYQFKNQQQTLIIPEIPENSFSKKLYSTYISYLPKEKISFPLKMNTDERGSFTELLKSEKVGQVSVNISKPGITKGEHWHNSKWEFFIVVSGKGLIRQRKIGTDEIIEFYVSGEKIEAVQMLPGYTHNIINLSETEDLITVMWANEQFDAGNPDTFFEKV